MDFMDRDELIERRMQQTRASLTEKLETLEQKVVGTVEEAATVASDTVASIKDTVNAVNSSVKEGVETVKDWCDVKAHVQQHPWLVVGGCVATGYCLGVFLEKNGSAQVESPRIIVPLPAASTHGNGRGNGVQAAPKREMAAVSPRAPETNKWAPEIAKLKSIALGVLFGTAREMIKASVPEHLGEQITEVIDSATTKAGGRPLPSSDWDGVREAIQRKSESENASDQESLDRPSCNGPATAEA